MTDVAYLFNYRISLILGKDFVFGKSFSFLFDFQFLLSNNQFSHESDYQVEDALGAEIGPDQGHDLPVKALAQIG